MSYEVTYIVRGGEWRIKDVKAQTILEAWLKAIETETKEITDQVRVVRIRGGR